MTDTTATAYADPRAGRIRARALAALEQRRHAYLPLDDLTRIERIGNDDGVYWRHADTGVELLENVRYPINQYRAAIDFLAAHDMLTVTEHYVHLLRAVPVWLTEQSRRAAINTPT